MGHGRASSSKPNGTVAPDRYVSFLDIDFEGNIAAVPGHLHRYIDDPAKGNAFWDRFKQRLKQCESGEDGTADKLLLLHSHVYYMAELFEEHDDPEALAALEKLEEECSYIINPILLVAKRKDVVHLHFIIWIQTGI